MDPSGNNVMVAGQLAPLTEANRPESAAADEAKAIVDAGEREVADRIVGFFKWLGTRAWATVQEVGRHGQRVEAMRYGSTGDKMRVAAEMEAEAKAAAADKKAWKRAAHATWEDPEGALAEVGQHIKENPQAAQETILDTTGEVVGTIALLEGGFRMVAGKRAAGVSDPKRGMTPADYGLQTVAENPEYLAAYESTLRKLAGGNNAYSRLLNTLEKGQAPSKAMLKSAWRAVGSELSATLRKAGHEIHTTHHWNWPKVSTYSEHIFDPRNLTPIPKTRPAGLHSDIHKALTSHPRPEAHPINKFVGPVKPEHAIDLGPPQSTLPH